MKLNRKQVRYLLLKEAKRQMLLEQRKRRKYVQVIDHVLLENKNIINSKYLHVQEINENIFDSLLNFGGGILGNLLPGFIGQFKQKIVVELLSSLGMDTSAPFAIALINVFEEIQYTKLIGYFKNWSSGGCDGFIDDIIRGLSDSLQEGIMSYFGLNVQAQGMLGGSFRESITTTVNKQFLPAIKDPIKNFICNLPVGDILGQIKDVATGKKSVKDVAGSILGKAGGALQSAGSSIKSAGSSTQPQTATQQAASRLFT